MTTGKHPPSTGATPELPPSNTVRWVVRRKAQVVAAVQDGLITLEEVCVRYALSVEEFLAWERGLKRHGVNGLRARVRQHS